MRMRLVLTAALVAGVATSSFAPIMVNAPPAEGDERRLLVPTHDRLEVPENAVVVAFFKRR